MQPHSPNPPSKSQEDPPSGCWEKPFEGFLQIIIKKKKNKKKKKKKKNSKESNRLTAIKAVSLISRKAIDSQSAVSLMI